MSVWWAPETSTFNHFRRHHINFVPLKMKFSNRKSTEKQMLSLQWNQMLVSCFCIFRVRSGAMFMSFNVVSFSCGGKFFIQIDEWHGQIEFLCTYFCFEFHDENSRDMNYVLLVDIHILVYVRFAFFRCCAFDRESIVENWISSLFMRCKLDSLQHLGWIQWTHVLWHRHVY